MRATRGMAPAYPPRGPMQAKNMNTVPRFRPQVSSLGFRLLLGPACEMQGRRFRNRSLRYHKRILISPSRLGKGRRTANDAPRKAAAAGRMPDTVPMGRGE